MIIHAEGTNICIYFNGNVDSGSGGRQVKERKHKQEGCKVKGLA